MQRLPIIIGLHCEVEKYPYEAAAFIWGTHLQAALEPQSAYSRVPMHLFEGTGALCDYYLRINPEALAMVRNHVDAGTLWVGPWYARPCELLASGESLIRNLLYGNEQARTLGIPTTICFIPPSPLHLLQLPQILASFGIQVVALPAIGAWPFSQSAYGVYRWHTEQVGSVTLVPLPVCSAEQLKQAIRSNIQQFPINALLCVASGHIERFGELLLQNKNTLQPLPLNSLVEQVKATHADQIQGELIPTLTSPLVSGKVNLSCGETDQVSMSNQCPDPLPSVYNENRLPFIWPWHAGDHSACSVSFVSTWPQLRSATWQAQVQLERWAEPWATIAWLADQSYPERYLAKAWRLLLINQMYDGVCDCLDNATYRYMLVQTEQAQQLADVICRQAFRAIVKAQSEREAEGVQVASAHCNASYLWVANPLGWPRDEIICADVLLPADTQLLQIIAADGRTIPYQLLRTETPAIQPKCGSNSHRRFTIAFRTGTIPATGFSRFLAQPAAHKPFFLGESIAAGNTLENKYLRVIVKSNGALRIEDKRTGYVYDNCNVFEDGGDIGSATAFAAPEQDKLITTYAAHAHSYIVENGVMAGTIQVQHDLELPATIHPLRDRRSEQRTVCEIISRITLKQGSDRVEIYTQVRNKAQDHRLRVLFSTDIPSNFCHVSQPFAVVERAEIGGAERQTLPKQEFVDISDADHGLLVVSRGTYEYEVKPTPAGTIALTLFRAIGAPDDPASASQAPDLLQFSYALIPHAGNWENALASAWEFCAPLRTFTNHDIGLDLSLIQPDQVSYSLVALAPQPLLLSAIKRSEDGQALIVRSFNPTARTIPGKLTCRLPISAAYIATLAEAPQSPLTPDDDYTLSLTFAPRQIITLRLGCTPGLASA